MALGKFHFRQNEKEGAQKRTLLFPSPITAEAKALTG
jgi:hypothetical protein